MPRWGCASELEEVVAAGDQVIVVMRTPGLDQHRGRRADDRTYDVVTVRDGRIVELHACRDHSEARSLAGISYAGLRAGAPGSVTRRSRGADTSLCRATIRLSYLPG